MAGISARRAPTGTFTERRLSGGTAIEWTTASLYWDPTTVLTSGQRAEFWGLWDELPWLNGPGPFWTGHTDTCWTGRLHAPRHVLYGGEHFTEFVYRQPRPATEVAALADAAWDDPVGGYGCDSDDRWTPGPVRAWWRERSRVVQHVEEQHQRWVTSDRSDEPEAAVGLAASRSQASSGTQARIRKPAKC